MKRLCVLLVLASAVTLEAQDHVRAGLLVSKPAGMPEAVYERWTEEVGRLLPLQGVEWEWHASGPPADEEWFNLIVFVRLKGRCRPGVSALPQTTPGPLGTCGYCDGEVMPFVTVDCDRVLKELRRALPYPVHYLPAAFARALARVTAHELYHALSGRREHHESGLGKGVLTGQDLTDVDFEFTPLALEQIRARLRGGVPAADPLTAETK